MTKIEIDYHTIINGINIYVDTNDYCYSDDTLPEQNKLYCISHINQQLEYHPLSKNPHLICIKCLNPNS